MGYTERDSVAPLDLLGSVDQGLSVENDKFFKGELDKFVGARVYHDANQATANNVLLTLTFNSERYDTDNIHDAVNPTRLTCRTAGKYLIVAQAMFAANAVGGRYFEMKLNGATIVASLAIPIGATAGWQTTLNLTTVYNLAVNDYIEFRVLQDSGGALNVVIGANYSPEFMMQRLGP